MNSDACFDSIGTNLRRYMGCHDCSTSCPGYNSYGCYIDLTDSFIKRRNKRFED